MSEINSLIEFSQSSYQTTYDLLVDTLPSCDDTPNADIIYQEYKKLYLKYLRKFERLVKEYCQENPLPTPNKHERYVQWERRVRLNQEKENQG